MGIKLTAKEVKNIKLLLSKGLDIADIIAVTGKSKETIRRVGKGERDYLIEVKKQLPKVEELKVTVLPIEYRQVNELAKAYNLIWNALIILEKIGGISNGKVN